MPAYTSRLALPYPLGTDPPNGPGQIESLANVLDTVIMPVTEDLSAIATATPTVANWSNNSKKITNLANGSASTDAAAFGQIPTVYAPGTQVSNYLTSNDTNETDTICLISLAAGTWLVVAVITTTNTNSSNTLEFWLIAASSPFASNTISVSAANGPLSGSIQGLVTVATTATIGLQYYSSNSGLTVHYKSLLNSLANATGIAAVRIA